MQYAMLRNTLEWREKMQNRDSSANGGITKKVAIRLLKKVLKLQDGYSLGRLSSLLNQNKEYLTLVSFWKDVG